MPGSVRPLALDLTPVHIPYHFRCPISLELMSDPVTVSTGQTYDRPSIESWISTGNTTCPVTRAPLSDFSLIPNHTLRRLIQSWCVAHRSSGIERIPTPKQPADPSLIRMLVSQSQLGGDLISRLSALRRIRTLALESDKNKSVIATTETRSALIHIVFEEANSDLSFESLSILSLFPLAEHETLLITSDPSRLSYLATLMTTMHNSVDAAAVMESVATASKSAEIRSVIGAMDGVIESFVSLVGQKENWRGVKVGVRGVFALCLAKENRRRAIDSGAIAAVMRRVGELKGGELERGLAAVELMCRVEGGREKVVVEMGREGVRELVSAMRRGGMRVGEHAVGVMVGVMVEEEEDEEEMKREAVEAGVVRELLVMVQSGCSERGKRKAQLLLKLLRAAWPVVVEGEVGGFEDDYYFQPY